MPEYDNNFTGVLFKHDKKGNEKAPDYKGSCEINHVELWLSAWIKTKKNSNEKFMSISFELKDGQSFGAAPADVDVPIDTSDFAVAAADEDIPF